MLDARDARKRTDRLFLEKHLEELNGYIEDAIEDGDYECYKYYSGKIASSDLFKQLVESISQKGYEVTLSDPDDDDEVKMNISWY